jgi:hypothetical protein
MLRKPLTPTDLGIILSYRCQCACKHCLYNCGPLWSDWMSREALREALLATRTWSHPLQVHFTGGEPFLNFPLLLDGVLMASHLGVPCYVETNAGWCLRGQDVAQKLTALRDAGLGAVLISCSPFHAESIPLARTLLAIEKAAEVFGHQRVMTYMSHCVDQIRQFSVHETVPLGRYTERLGLPAARRLLWDGYSIIPAGRSGYHLGHLTAKRPASAFREQNCRLEILHAHHSHFDLYGNYISWFCGGLSVGPWRELPRVLTDYEAGNFPPIIDTLIASGPYGLLQRASKLEGYQELPDGYAGKCHLCVDVRRHLADSRDIPELQPRQFYQMI